MYFSSAARMAPRRHRNMPAFQATPPDSNSSRARAGCGLLLERAQRVGLQPADPLAGLEARHEVAVLGRGVGRLDARASRAGRATPNAPGREAGGRIGDDLPEDALARRVDPLVGREHDHDLVVVAVDGQRREGDRRRGVAPRRLGEDPDAGRPARGPSAP